MLQIPSPMKPGAVPSILRAGHRKGCEMQGSIVKEGIPDFGRLKCVVCGGRFDEDLRPAIYHGQGLFRHYDCKPNPVIHPAPGRRFVDYANHKPRNAGDPPKWFRDPAGWLILAIFGAGCYAICWAVIRLLWWLGKSLLAAI